MRKHLVLLIGLALALSVASRVAVAQLPVPATNPGSIASPPSPDAESVYAAARPRLLQIRTLVVAAADRQSSIGSGFLVAADGLAITNYHVVSQYALEPGTYRLEFRTADDQRGQLQILAIDLANDLALVRIDHHEQPFFEFDPARPGGALPKGERLYSMGVPLDLGFAIVDGTYNGPVEHSYSERIHFSGAINPGMSGGPTVTAGGRVAGINVAKQLGGELVSFLVPARFAQALLEHARANPPPSAAELRADIGRQFTAWQAGLYKSFGDLGFRKANFGPYQVPESASPWFTCWGRTNAAQVPSPRARVDTTNCDSDTSLFIADDLTTGRIHLSNSLVKTVDLNRFQFAAFLSGQARPGWLAANRKWHTGQSCHEDFVAADPAGERPVLRATWCARAYREFAGLYDVTFMTVTENRSDEAMVSRLSLQGIAYDTAIGLAKRFLETVQWTK